jgi:BMFP domain-containing protein YqiC
MLVLNDIRKLAGIVREDESKFLDMINRHSQEQQSVLSLRTVKHLEQMKQRVAELDNLFMRIYEDRVAGRLTEERYSMMSTRYETEQSGLKEEIQTLEAQMQSQKQSEQDEEFFVALVKRYVNVEALDRRMVMELIDKIIIHEAEGKKFCRIGRRQKVEIYYNFIGQLCQF